MQTKIHFLTILIVCSITLVHASDPVISIITSLYKGEKYIEGFLEDIVKQTVFDTCELIIINANSPENEEPFIQEYVKKYKNIIYKKLDKDPGLYGVWNKAIKMARGKFITNANVDDRLAYDCYEIHVRALLDNPEIDLVYSDCYLTKVPNENFYHNSSTELIVRPEFSKKILKTNCLPNNHPMWRKAMHVKFGFFNEKFKIAGDWDMWLRAVNKGSKFLKIPKILSLYYENPQGLSTDNGGNWRKEFELIVKTYKKI